MNTEQLNDIGAGILRITLGGIFLAHSAYLKFVVFSLAGTAQFFESVGLPSWSAYPVFMLEVAGGIALIAGSAVRWASLALIPVALGATWVHWSAGWVFSNEGGGWEYPALLAVALLVQACLGPGRLVPRRSSAVHPVHEAG